MTTKSKAPLSLLPYEIQLAMSQSDVATLIQVLSFSKEIFMQMSLKCAAEGDSNGEATFLARSILSETLFQKIRTAADIGEPTSKDLH